MDSRYGSVLLAGSFLVLFVSHKGQKGLRKRY